MAATPATRTLARRVAGAARSAGHHRRRVGHLARRTFAAHRTIVVPLLGDDESEHALALACRLAADRRARVLLLAPLVIEPGLPLAAAFDDEEQELKARLSRARAQADSYGISSTRRIVRTRNVAEDVVREASEEHASLIVLGAPILSRHGFDSAFPKTVQWILRDAHCRVMVATGAFVGAGENGRPRSR